MRAVLLLLSLSAFAADNEPITLPTSPEDLARGKKLFLGSCTYCHGPTGDGGKGADLSRQELVRAKTDSDLARISETGIPGTEMPGAWHMTRREVTQVAAFVRSLAKVNTHAVPGDPARGQALYRKHACATCHTVKTDGTYAGGFMGPDLSSIGLRRSPAHLREAITDPAASVAENFMLVKVATKSGKSLEGVRLHEDTFSIVLRDLAGNNHALLKQDVKSSTLNRKASPMPSFQGKLSAAELDDLIAYLVSLKEPL
jgi:putative heme-binding domain-containing protein